MDVKEQNRKLYVCLEKLERLDEGFEWEREFINSLANLPAEQLLTPRQEAKMMEIYDKLT